MLRGESLNKEGREQLSEALEMIMQAQHIISQVTAEEEEKHSNLESAGLEYSPVGERMENGISHLYTAHDSCDEAINYIEEAMA